MPTRPGADARSPGPPWILPPPVHPKRAPASLHAGGARGAGGGLPEAVRARGPAEAAAPAAAARPPTTPTTGARARAGAGQLPWAGPWVLLLPSPSSCASLQLHRHCTSPPAQPPQPSTCSGAAPNWWFDPQQPHLLPPCARLQPALTALTTRMHRLSPWRSSRKCPCPRQMSYSRARWGPG